MKQTMAAPYSKYRPWGPSSPALPVGQRRCSRSGNPYGQPRWGFLGSGESASVRFRKSKKGRDFPSPRNKWKLMKSWKVEKFLTFNKFTQLFFVIFSVLTMPGHNAPAKHGRSSRLSQEHAVPSLAASYVRRLQSVRQNLRQKSQGRSMGNFVVFGRGEGCFCFWQVFETWWCYF